MKIHSIVLHSMIALLTVFFSVSCVYTNHLSVEDASTNGLANGLTANNPSVNQTQKYKPQSEDLRASGWEDLHASQWNSGNGEMPGRNTKSKQIQVAIKKQIQVTINKNIEIFGLMLQLDNGGDVLASKDSVTLNNNKRVPMSVWYGKTVDNYRRYKEFDSCDMMKRYRDYEAKGFYNDFFVGFLLEVDEVPFAKINDGTDDEVLLPFSSKGDLAEAKRNATAFLTALNDFYKKVAFDRYLEDNRKFYELAKSNVQKCLPPADFISVMETFYQKQFNAYYLVPSLNIPTGMGFGKMNKKTKTIFNTFGPFTYQSFDPNNPIVGYDQTDHIQDLSIHEFGHSFVNPAIDRVPDTLIKSTAYLFQPIEQAMRKQSYPSWTICLYEHFVRAGQAVIDRKLGDTATAAKIISDNVKTGFIYLPVIMEELEKYGHDPKKYASYDAFVSLVLEKLKQSNPK